MPESRAWFALFAASGIVAATVLVLMLAFLVVESWPALRGLSPARFFADASWHPPEGLFNMTPMVLGSVLVTAGALLIALPLGVLAAVFGRFYAPRPLARVHDVAMTLLAGVPSVVYGLWGLTCLVPFIRRVHPPGPSLVAGSIVLSIMILPTIAVTAKASMEAVPREVVDAAESLGLGRASIIRHVVLASARGGIESGVVLAGGRAIGETMALLMVSGNAVAIPRSIFDSVRTLTANIALEMSYALGLHQSALFVSGLVLAVVVALVALASEVVRRRRPIGVP